MDPIQALRYIRKQLGLSDYHLAFALDIQQRAIARWFNGESFPQPEAHWKIKELQEICERIIEQIPENDERRKQINGASLKMMMERKSIELLSDLVETDRLIAQFRTQLR